MSKIQKALGKLRNGQPAATDKDDATGKHKRPPALGRLVEHVSLDDTQVMNSKRLHVDSNELREAGLIAPQYHEELLANQYRDIKRPLIAHAFGKRATKVENGNLIMVTSALAGEGKTFTSINLALSMARERDYSVLLVDADVAKPHTSAMFGASDEAGLLDFLEDPALAVGSLILPTDVENLSLLPAGMPRSHSTELLASAAMDDLCDLLRDLSTGQIIIFDSPPLLQTSEAKVLASIAGQIVLVVRAEETSQDAVKAALGSLDAEKAVNLVLNQARSSRGDPEYGYGYGYGYDYGDKKQRAKPQPESSGGSLFD